MTIPSGGRVLAALAEHLEGVRFPADRAALQRHAERSGAPRDIIDRLRDLENREYDSIGAVGLALGMDGAAAAATHRSGTLGTGSVVDEASAGSFPASDPPAYTPGGSGGKSPESAR